MLVRGGIEAFRDGLGLLGHLNGPMGLRILTGVQALPQLRSSRSVEVSVPASSGEAGPSHRIRTTPRRAADHPAPANPHPLPASTSSRGPRQGQPLELSPGWQQQVEARGAL
jgi:hypothetical protein